MPAPTVQYSIRVPVAVAEALEAEIARSGRTKTEIVVAALKRELAKEAKPMIASTVANRCNTALDVNALRTAQALGLDRSVDQDATERLLDVIGDSDPVAFRDGSWVRCTDEGRYVADDDVAAWLDEHGR